MLNVAEKRLVNFSSSPHKKMQSTGERCYISALWSKPLPTAMEKMIDQVNINYLMISK